MISSPKAMQSSRKDTVIAVSITKTVQRVPEWLLDCKNLQELEIIGDTVILTEELNQLIKLKKIRIKAKPTPNLFINLLGNEDYKKRFEALPAKEQMRIQDSANQAWQKSERERKPVYIKFAKLNYLTWLDLSNCYLIRSPKTLKNAVNVDTLFLSRNRLLDFPKKTRKLKSLSALFLDYNSLTVNKIRFPKIKNLKKLSIAYGNLKEIPKSIKKMPNLLSLALAGNQISYISHKLGKLDKLRQIILYKNKLDSLPEVIYQLRALEELDIYYNNVKKISSKISYLKNLTHLYLSYNQITTLPNEIGDLAFFTRNIHSPQ
jgi:Leucine-rich repeat (LRR) protein